MALLIFIIASITDAYDGYYARKYNEITTEGKFLDPLADKILVSSAFISFALLGIIDFWMVGIIIFRDFFVTGLRIAMEQKGMSMVTSMVAKLKTSAQMTIITLILIALYFSKNFLSKKFGVENTKPSAHTAITNTIFHFAK